MKSIAIIGGGITGLTAAWQLQRAGAPVTLYEAGERVGGVIRSLRRDGYLAEFGPNTLLETSPKIRQLIQDLGLAQRRLEPDPRAANRYVVRNKKPVCLPGSPFAFFTSPLFSTSAKLHLLREPFVGRATGEESIGAFVKRRLGQEFLDYAIDPLVCGIYAGDPARLSVRHAFPKIDALEKTYGSLIKGQIFGARERRKRGEVSKATAPKFSFDEGLQVLTDTLAAALGPAVHLNSAVQRVTQTADGWNVTFACHGQTGQAGHSAVLYAGTAFRLAELQLATGAQDSSPAQSGSAPRRIDLSPFARIHYPPVASVVLGFKREDVAHPLDGFGMLIPGIEGFQILGTIFSSSLFPNRAPAGHVTLTVYIGGARKPELALQSEPSLVNTAMRDLKTILGVRGQPGFQHITVFQHAIPQYEVGYGEFKDRMDQVEKDAPGFYLAGHFRNGVSLSDSVLAGLNVADRIRATQTETVLTADSR